ncbi:hypothetical protein AAIA72_12540 [Hahella sp. SMD15-11]|uniref:Uncharacterized protein n=1 Tax=Thermohahella caldifontis TaxID=3142973 RepID=A0AB39UUJ9_9GAMM
MARTHQYLSAFSLCLLISALPPSSVQASGNHAGKSEAVVQKKVFNIDIGGFIRLAIPMAMLEQSLLVPIDGGVMMVFPEGGSFDASVLPDTQTGFPGADMRRAPAYMFGQGSGSDSGDAFQKEMQKMGRIFIQTYQPISPIRKFDMEGGRGTGWKVPKIHSSFLSRKKSVTIWSSYPQRVSRVKRSLTGFLKVPGRPGD